MSPASSAQQIGQRRSAAKQAQVLVFAVEARDRIKADATRLSVLACLLVAAALLAVYRSPLILVLAFVPVVTGALAGIAAVGLAGRGPVPPVQCRPRRPVDR